MTDRNPPTCPGARIAARAIDAGYADPAAPCDIPGCRRRCGGIRVITVTPAAGTQRSIPYAREGGAATDAETILVRLCVGHAKVPHSKLLRLLPVLAEFTPEAAVRGPEGDHTDVKTIPPLLAESKARKTHAADDTAAR